MSLFVTSLASGSNGNCYYIGNSTEAILVDAGISCREIEKRMKRLELSLQKVKAVFISHEHSDHIHGLALLSKKYNLKVYITAPTLRNSRLLLQENLVASFKGYENITIGELTVTPFPKFHDAADPYSFIIKHNEIQVGVFTDIGVPCEHVIYHFKQCHAAFLEANYDEAMLENGNYPYHLKKRIQGNNGHLSNTQALTLFDNHRPVFMSHLFLSHLSKNNNCPKLVAELFSRQADGVTIVVASRYEETGVYTITALSKRDSLSGLLLTAPLQLQFAFA